MCIRDRAKKESQNNLTLFDVMKKEVTYHNDFSNTIFTDFTLKEKQLLLFLIAGIKDTDPDNKVYSFNPKEVKRMLNMTRQSYSLLSEFVFSLQKKPLTILKPNKKIEAISIFDKVVYSPNDESIDVKWKCKCEGKYIYGVGGNWKTIGKRRNRI